MQNVFAKSIYYKVNPMNPGYYSVRYPNQTSTDVNYKDREVYGRLVQLDKDQYTFIKLYEQSSGITRRVYNTTAPNNDTALSAYNISSTSPLTAKINDISIASNLKWDEVLKMTWNEKGTNDDTKERGRWWVEKEFENHIDSVGSKQFCNAVIQGTDGAIVDQGG